MKLEKKNIEEDKERYVVTIPEAEKIFADAFVNLFNIEPLKWKLSFLGFYNKYNEYVKEHKVIDETNLVEVQ